MKLAIIQHWHRGDENLLNRKAEIRKEMQDTLLRPFEGILPESREGYIDTVRGGFVSKGWDMGSSVTDKQWNVVTLMDLCKDKVGVILGFDPDSAVERILGFQKAQESKKTAIDFGIYVVPTRTCQRELGRELGARWRGPDFAAVQEYLSDPQVGELLQVPVCVMGLDVRDVPSSIDLAAIEPPVLRELVLTLVESKYGTVVLKNVRLQDLKDRIWEFDGITRFEDRDMVFAIEVAGASREFGSRLFTESKDPITHLADTLDAYKEIAYRPIVARFILVGQFSTQKMQAVHGACEHLGFAVNTTVDYEQYSVEEFESFLEDMRDGLRG